MRKFSLQIMVALLILVCGIVQVSAYSQGVTEIDSDTAELWIIENDTNRTWADVHYKINNGGQLNYRMNKDGATRYYWRIDGLNNGDNIVYFFTVGDPAYDTPWYDYTFGGGGSTSPPTPPPTSPPGGGWDLVWEDNFDGSGQPNSSNWNYHVGNGFNPGLGDFQGWGNGEWEWYRPENAYQSGGNLVIRADYNSSPTVIAGRNWYQFSSRLTTQGKRSWQYGKIEARIKLPTAASTWPAFWMMGTSCDGTYTSNYYAPMSYYDTMAGNWSSCGEVDIMEHKNGDTTYVQNLFWDTRIGVYPWGDGLNANNPSTNYVGNVAQYHLYGIEWNSTEIKWTVDGNVIKTQNISASNMEEFRKPFFLILNLAISGTFTGPTYPNQADFPLYMYVDYVRVYQ